MQDRRRHPRNSCFILLPNANQASYAVLQQLLFFYLFLFSIRFYYLFFYFFIFFKHFMSRPAGLGDSWMRARLVIGWLIRFLTLPGSCHIEAAPRLVIGSRLSVYKARLFLFICIFLQAESQILLTKIEQVFNILPHTLQKHTFLPV